MQEHGEHLASGPAAADPAGEPGDQAAAGTREDAQQADPASGTGDLPPCPANPAGQAGGTPLGDEFEPL
jgi:hypothetical protein